MKICGRRRALRRSHTPEESHPQEAVDRTRAAPQSAVSSGNEGLVVKKKKNPSRMKRGGKGGKKGKRGKAYRRFKKGPDDDGGMDDDSSGDGDDGGTNDI